MSLYPIPTGTITAPSFPNGGIPMSPLSPDSFCSSASSTSSASGVVTRRKGVLKKSASIKVSNRKVHEGGGVVVSAKSARSSRRMSLPCVTGVTAWDLMARDLTPDAERESRKNVTSSIPVPSQALAELISLGHPINNNNNNASTSTSALDGFSSLSSQLANNNNRDNIKMETKRMHASLGLPTISSKSLAKLPSLLMNGSNVKKEKAPSQKTLLSAAASVASNSSTSMTSGGGTTPAKKKSKSVRRSSLTNSSASGAAAAAAEVSSSSLTMPPSSSSSSQGTAISMHTEPPSILCTPKHFKSARRHSLLGSVPYTSPYASPYVHNIRSKAHSLSPKSTYTPITALVTPCSSISSSTHSTPDGELTTVSQTSSHDSSKKSAPKSILKTKGGGIVDFSGERRFSSTGLLFPTPVNANASARALNDLQNNVLRACIEEHKKVQQPPPPPQQPIPPPQTAPLGLDSLPVLPTRRRGSGWSLEDDNSHDTKGQDSQNSNNSNQVRSTSNSTSTTTGTSHGDGDNRNTKSTTKTTDDTQISHRSKSVDESQKKSHHHHHYHRSSSTVEAQKVSRAASVDDTHKVSRAASADDTLKNHQSRKKKRDPKKVDEKEKDHHNTSSVPSKSVLKSAPREPIRGVKPSKSAQQPGFSGERRFAPSVSLSSSSKVQRRHSALASTYPHQNLYIRSLYQSDAGDDDDDDVENDDDSEAETDDDVLSQKKPAARSLQRRLSLDSIPTMPQRRCISPPKQYPPTPVETLKKPILKTPSSLTKPENAALPGFIPCLGEEEKMNQQSQRSPVDALPLYNRNDNDQAPKQRIRSTYSGSGALLRVEQGLRSSDSSNSCSSNSKKEEKKRSSKRHSSTTSKKKDDDGRIKATSEHRHEHRHRGEDKKKKSKHRSSSDTKKESRKSSRKREPK